MSASRLHLFRLFSLILLVLGLVGAVYWVALQESRSTGPTVMTRGADGSVWLAINQRIFITAPTGETLQQLEPGALGVPLPLRAMAPLDDGSVLVAGGRRGALYAISPAGLARRVSAVPGAAGAMQLAAAPGGDRLLVADSGNHRVLMLDVEGQVLQTSQSTQLDLRYPEAVRFLPGGGFAVVDTDHQRIVMANDEMRPQGLVRACEPEPCEGLFRWPNALEVLSDGGMVFSLLDDRMERGELVQLAANGRSRRTLELADNAWPTDILALEGDFLVTDRSNFRILRYSRRGQPGQDFGDFTIRAALENAALERARYREWTRVGQMALLGVLGILVLLYARGWFVRFADQDDEASPREASRFGLRLQWLLLSLLSRSFLLTLLVVVLGVIFYLPKLVEQPLETWSLLAGIPILALLPGLVADHSLQRHAAHGSFGALWQAEATMLLHRYAPLVRRALAEGERPEWVGVARHRQGSRLLVLTSTRLAVLTLCRSGTVMGFGYVPRISIGKVGKGRWRPGLLRRLMKPEALFMVRFRAGECAHELLLPDQPAATVLADRLRSTARGLGPKDARPIDVPVGRMAFRSPGTVQAMLASVLLPGGGQLLQQRMAAGLFYLLAWGAAVVTLIPTLNTLFDQVRDVPLFILIPTVAAGFLVWLVALLDTLLFSPDFSRPADF